MAKKREKNLKPMPRRGEVWQYTPADSSKPVETWEIQAIDGSGNKATLDVLISWDDASDQRQSRKDVIPITKFADPHVELVNATGAAEEAAPPPKPVVIVAPIKNGIAFTCPGQDCGDEHKFIIDSVDFDTFIAKVKEAHTKFVERHAPHMFAGTLWAGHHE